MVVRSRPTKTFRKLIVAPRLYKNDMFFLGFFAGIFSLYALFMVVAGPPPMGCGEEEHPDVCGYCDDEVCVFEACDDVLAPEDEPATPVPKEPTPMDLRRQLGSMRQPEVEETHGDKVGYEATTQPAENELRRRIGDLDSQKRFDADTGMSTQD